MGQAIGAVVGAVSSRSLQKRGISAAKRAAAEARRFTQFNVRSGIGTASVGAGNQVNLSLNSRFQNLSDILSSQGEGLLGQVETTTKGAEDRLLAGFERLSAPGEARARTQLENRLQSQGLLGATGGADRFQSLLEAQNLAGVARETQAITLAQTIQDQIQERGLRAIQGSIGLENAPLGLSNVGSTLSGKGSAQAANLLFQGAQNANDASASFWKQISGSIAQSGRSSQSAEFGSDVGTSDVGNAGMEFMSDPSGPSGIF